MFEHVREAGGAAGIVDRAGVHVGVKADDGRVVTFNDQEVQAVGEGEAGYCFLEILQGLGGKQAREQEEKETEPHAPSVTVGQALCLLRACRPHSRRAGRVPAAGWEPALLTQPVDQALGAVEVLHQVDAGLDAQDRGQEALAVRVQAEAAVGEFVQGIGEIELRRHRA